jgi:hypothetical protein
MVPIRSDCKVYIEPYWMRRTVERLLTSLPPAHSQRLSAIVLTEAAVADKRRQTRHARKNRFGTTQGIYHVARDGEAAWIELVVDAILSQLPKPFYRPGFHQCQQCKCALSCPCS